MIDIILLEQVSMWEVIIVDKFSSKVRGSNQLYFYLVFIYYQDQIFQFIVLLVFIKQKNIDMFVQLRFYFQYVFNCFINLVYV